MTEAHLLPNLYQEEIYRIKPKILIVVNAPWSEVTDDEIILLEKILAASKLTLASVHVICRPEFSVRDFKVFSPPIIVAFGSKLKNSDKVYEALSIEGTTVVVADALHQLDDTRKRNLWATLKQVFHS